jgi:hypothetical protein
VLPVGLLPVVEVGRLPVVVAGRLPVVVVVEVVDVGRLTVVVDVGLVLLDVGLFAGLFAGLFVGRPVLVLPPPVVPPPLAGSCWAIAMLAPANVKLVNTIREIRGWRRICI